ncbi:MAG: penicillin-binding protein 2 [Dactylosporangium sp.]|nr:penicillin-binding protein 2 [Dactylosporangium sp.]NNJ61567.1 penicillin-binding protein 2 [Dactylosporangium sp.]
MNAPLRRVGVVALVLFAMLFVNLNYQQWYKADDYRTNPRNTRVQAEEYSRPRGTISLSNGEVVAQSQETTDTFKYLRVYPFDTKYAHVVGYKPVYGTATYVERLNNEFLAGNAPEQLGDRLAAMFTGNESPGGIVQLTLSKAAQDTAHKELTSNRLNTQKGAVIALDPKTGALLAEVSLPSYDPNLLTTHNADEASKAYQTLDADPTHPLSNRATSEILAPGSTMKVVVSAAALKEGMKPDTVIPAGPYYQPPQSGSFQIKNASPSTCPEAQITLQRALTVSCNTAFAKLGVEQLGLDKVKSMAESFGFEETPEFIDDDKNIMNVTASHTGSMTGSNGKVDPAALAQSSIGQKDVRMTPLQGALIAATVANEGKQMRPYLVDTLQSSGLSVVNKTQPTTLRRVVSDGVAEDLQDMMISVVDSGTGKPAKVKGLQVGGKTGTAENGEDANDHGWFIGFAMKNNQPVVAVAVVLEGAGKGGSHEAARIAGQVMKAYADERGTE